MRTIVTGLVAGALAWGAPPAAAETQTILGLRFWVKSTARDGRPQRRGAYVRAKEPLGTPNTVVGDPTVHGATLRVIARGESVSYDQTFDLPAEGWKDTLTMHDWPVYKGFAFRNLETGGAVRYLKLERSGFATPEGQPLPEEPKEGVFRLVLRILGKDGPIDVLPPDPGVDGGIILTLGGGDTYCIAFGGAAGGKVSANNVKRFVIRKPVAEGCPSP